MSIHGSRYRNSAGDLDEVVTIAIRNTGRFPFTVDGLGFPTGPGFGSASYPEGPADRGYQLPVTVDAGGPSLEFQRIVKRSNPDQPSWMKAEVRTADGRKILSADRVEFPITEGWIVG